MWTMSELTATIICVTIPALRPLHNRLTGGSSTGGPYQNYGNDNRKSGAAHGSEFGLTSRRTKNGKMQCDCDVTQCGNDTDSDTGILSATRPGAKDGGIRSYQEVTVTYEDGQSATRSEQHL